MEVGTSKPLWISFSSLRPTESDPDILLTHRPVIDVKIIRLVDRLAHSIERWNFFGLSRADLSWCQVVSTRFGHLLESHSQLDWSPEKRT